LNENETKLLQERADDEKRLDDFVEDQKIADELKEIIDNC